MVRVHLHIKKITGRTNLPVPASPHYASTGYVARRSTRNCNSLPGYQ